MKEYRLGKIQRQIQQGGHNIKLAGLVALSTPWGKMEKTNPVLKETVRKLEEKSRKEDVAIWKEVAESLKQARRGDEPVNLAKINRHTEGNEWVVVPGKVTGYGNLDKEVKVAAFSFSKSAKEKLEEEGEPMQIEELLEKNPSGSGVKIME